MVSEFYIMHWPKNFSAMWVNGSTIRYSEDRSVYYANEVLSPGQIICTWESASDFLSSGNAPSLPLLNINQYYDLNIKIQADNELPVQIRIEFFDARNTLIDSFQDTDFPLIFKVPEGTVSYKIHLVNLKHRWIKFDRLSISEHQETTKRINSTVIKRHYALVKFNATEGAADNKVNLIVNKGVRSTLAFSVKKNIECDQIFIYTDGKEVKQLIESLLDTFSFKSDTLITIEPGIGFYNLPKDFVPRLEKGIKRR